MPKPKISRFDRKRFSGDLSTYLEVCYRPRRSVSAAREKLANLAEECRKPTLGIWEALHNLDERHGGVSLKGSAFKRSFREYLEPQQNDQCCYCLAPLQNIAHAKPIEHILPRSTYPQFALHFWNLSIACFNCNQGKGESDWYGFDSDRKQYPMPGLFSEAFHPRFHVHAEHVRVDRLSVGRRSVCIPFGRTTQGRQLCTALLKHTAAMEIRYGGDDEFRDVLDRLTTAVDADLDGDESIFRPFMDALWERVRP